jgi:hypothetical protein
MALPAALNTTSMLGGQNDLATWIIAISILVSTVLSILAFLGIAQGMQLRVWRGQIESRLKQLEGYVSEVEEESRKLLRRLGAKDPDRLVKRVADYFVVEPVSIEPTDITRRLERVLRTEEERIEKIVELELGYGYDEVLFKNAVTLLGISNALNTLYKYIRHLLLLGIKTKNAMLVAQLWMMLPFYMRIAKAYRDAAKTISKGLPIGDAAGPMAALRLSRSMTKLDDFHEVTKDTVVGVFEYEGRRVYLIRARGPGSTVGRPGEAVEKVVAEHVKEPLAAIITIDAALKFEGEETGSIAEGSGVAMGDPGPEKIRIERLAVRKKIPLYAIAIKMGFEEAINVMKKEVVNGVNRAVEEAKRLIIEAAASGESVIVVGVGNTIGIGL